MTFSLEIKTNLNRKCFVRYLTVQQVANVLSYTYEEDVLLSKLKAISHRNICNT